MGNKKIKKKIIISNNLIISNKHRCFIVAEISANHSGSLSILKKTMLKAKQAGADAVKFQNYKTEDFISDRNMMYTYRNKGREVTEPQYDMFKRCELSLSDLYELKACCDENKVESE